MAIRLIVTITAAPGKGSELAHLYKARCTDIAKEPGCEQFEVFQSVVNPDRLTLLERWSDQAALDAHAKVKPPARRSPPSFGLAQLSARTTCIIARASETTHSPAHIHVLRIVKTYQGPSWFLGRRGFGAIQFLLLLTPRACFYRFAFFLSQTTSTSILLNTFPLPPGLRTCRVVAHCSFILTARKRK